MGHGVVVRGCFFFGSVVASSFGFMGGWVLFDQTAFFDLSVVFCLLGKDFMHVSEMPPLHESFRRAHIHKPTHLPQNPQFHDPPVNRHTTLLIASPLRRLVGKPASMPYLNVPFPALVASSRTLSMWTWLQSPSPYKFYHRGLFSSRRIPLSVQNSTVFGFGGGRMSSLLVTEGNDEGWEVGRYAQWWARRTLSGKFCSRQATCNGRERGGVVCQGLKVTGVGSQRRHGQMWSAPPIGTWQMRRAPLIVQSRLNHGRLCTYILVLVFIYMEPTIIHFPFVVVIFMLWTLFSFAYLVFYCPYRALFSSYQERAEWMHNAAKFMQNLVGSRTYDEEEEEEPMVGDTGEEEKAGNQGLNELEGAEAAGRRIGEKEVREWFQRERNRYRDQPRRD